jgi:DNA-directed RNA polymerase specialized sigma subunit
MVMLSPISRRVVELWLEGLSKSQIAAEVGLGEEDISRIGIRAIEQVRAILDRSSDARGIGPQKR